MLFTKNHRTAIADDPDPRVGPINPDTDPRVFTIEQYLDEQLRAPSSNLIVAVNVLTAGDVVCTDGAATMHLWMFDELTKLWYATPDSAAAIPYQTIKPFRIPAFRAKARFYAQITTVSGTAPAAAAHLDVLFAPSRWDY